MQSEYMNHPLDTDHGKIKDTNHGIIKRKMIVYTSQMNSWYNGAFKKVCS